MSDSQSSSRLLVSQSCRGEGDTLFADEDSPLAIGYNQGYDDRTYDAIFAITLCNGFSRQCTSSWLATVEGVTSHD